MNTLTAFGLVLFAVPALGLAQTSGSSLQLKPLFVPTELIVNFDENLLVSGGRTLDEIYSAAGVTEITVFPTFAPGSHIALVRLKADSTFGRAFQTIQAFDFGAPARWALREMHPNFLYFAPESMPPVWTRPFNLSARAEVRQGESVTIGGMIVPGEFPRLVVFKVSGPSLRQFGVTAPLENPRLTLFRGNQKILENDDWGQLRNFEIQLTRGVCSTPGDAREAMIATYLDPGVYSAIVSGADGGTGIALLEMYVVDQFMVN